MASLKKQTHRWSATFKNVSNAATKLTGREQKSKQRGSLVFVGCGIRCASQFTQEAIDCIEQADRVFYCVSDPATETYIRKLNPNSTDLYVLYGNTKKRYATYVQMSESCLHYARRGMNVVGVFYGHPGVFVLPSHRAVEIANNEGIPARILPGISAEDCLVADLNIDPSLPGMQTLEATDYLLRRRTLLSDLHVVIWQVGCVGDTGFNFKGYKNENFSLLIDSLQKVYGPDYVIVHYICNQFPICRSRIDHVPLSDFHKPEIAKQVTGVSTFYIPPAVV
ncbi:uncharacterized protein [Oscarella lobularis]|uniref:uncharacterized protein isoform X2 n=1 Tax=Oscarella lobularis TaxID=121494 RepID=UPI003313677D